ncbi:MAG: AI-2E family transporter [Sphaerochaetaceae bacterium]|nr:AI-2E family transporter [Sphaerochaetaceae bacterium]MDC7250538.1 AI-2E family transporter [Sphaerochaetaceae bacterium]
MKENSKSTNYVKFLESNKYLKGLAYAVITFVIIFSLKAASSVLLPIVFACFVMLILFPLLEKLDKLHVPYWISNTIGILLFLAFLVVVGILVFMVIQRLIIGIPAYGNRLNELDLLLTSKVGSFLDFETGDTFLSRMDINWINIALTSLTNISSHFATVMKNILLVFIFLFFLILERHTLTPKIKEAFNGQNSKIIVSIAQRTTHQISRYLFIKFTISLITGILFYLTATVTNLDFAILWGLLAFVLNFIPSIGSLIATLVTITMALIQFTPDWISIIYVAVLTISIQTVLGNIIDPRLQGIQLGLSPFVLLVSLSLWGFIWGIPGMFLAVPLTSMIQILCVNIEGMRPIAILLGSGKRIQRRYQTEQSLEKKARKRQANGKNMSKEDYEILAAKNTKNSTDLNDFILPDSFDLNN